MEQIDNEEKSRQRKYVVENKNSLFSLEIVNQSAQMGRYEDVKPLYDALDVSIQNINAGKMLHERVKVLERSRLGSQALAFTQNDQNGNAVSFEEYKGKYVLIDFWASWCGPCREENPNVLKQYDQYKDQNFTVLGVSLDDNEEDWKKAILDDKMPWVQVSDLNGFENLVSSYYGIRAIPSTLLVDPDGSIIAKDLRGESLAKKLSEIFDSK